MTSTDGPPVEENAKSRAFRCPTCSAQMRFDAAQQAMLCDHCGATKAIRGEQGSSNVFERDLEDGLAREAERGLGADVRAARCQECGATVSFTESETAKSCDFCGSSQVLEQQANRNLIRPEWVVPFGIDRRSASDSFSRWLKKLWFRPSDLSAKAKVTEIGGVYVPYWTFDCDVESDWTAEAGFYYYETETTWQTDDEGNDYEETREVQRIRWEPAWGARADHYDDFLVCASVGLPRKLADRVSNFDTSQLKGYDPAYLAGWRAEEYAVDLNAAWQKAVDAIEAEQQSRCADDVPGDTQQFLAVSNYFSGERYKHVLLPIWISAYRYGDKVFRFLVNGQTGEVVGKAPYSAGKIALFALSLAAIVAGIVVAVLLTRK